MVHNKMITVCSFHMSVHNLLSSKHLVTHRTLHLLTGLHMDTLHMSLPIDQLTGLFPTQHAEPGLAAICGQLQVGGWVW